VAVSHGKLSGANVDIASSLDAKDIPDNYLLNKVM
jgi:hypothetical protein